MFVVIISLAAISACIVALYSSGRPGMGNWPAKASTSALISATRCWNFPPWHRAWMNSFRGALGSRLLCTSKVSIIPSGERRAGRAFRLQFHLCEIMLLFFFILVQWMAPNTTTPIILSGLSYGEESNQSCSKFRSKFTLLHCLSHKVNWLKPLKLIKGVVYDSNPVHVLSNSVNISSQSACFLFCVCA